MILTDGTWKALAYFAAAGENPKRPGVITLQISVVIDEGPDRGKQAHYSEEITGKNSRYVAQAARAIGWQAKGPLEQTIAADFAAWKSQTGGKTTAEIQTLERKDGSGRFSKVRSVGRAPQAELRISVDSEASRWSHEQMLAALAEMERDSGAAPAVDRAVRSDIDRAAQSYGSDAPPPSDTPDDEIPF